MDIPVSCLIGTEHIATNVQFAIIFGAEDHKWDDVFTLVKRLLYIVEDIRCIVPLVS